MINLDQVRTLEWKVKQAVQLIVHLRRENDTLRGRLSDTEVRLQELESVLEALKADQNAMESGIRSALEELDHLEGASASPAVSVDPAAKAPEAPVDLGVSGVPAADFVVEEPSVPEESPVPEEPAQELMPPDSDLSFEEEYAALAAAEAAAIADEAPVEALAVPPSVDLEEEAAASEGDLFDEPVPPAAQEDREPEQPGLGIF
jgi:FtsZ-binding cell division protein ZapB